MTKFTLSRDLANPMKLQPQKTCLRCKVPKANDFKNFGKKLWRSRTEYTTTDICLDCKRLALRTTLKQKSDVAAEFAKWSRDQAFERAQSLAKPLGSVPDPDEKV